MTHQRDAVTHGNITCGWVSQRAPLSTASSGYANMVHKDACVAAGSAAQPAPAISFGFPPAAPPPAAPPAQGAFRFGLPPSGPSAPGAISFGLPPAGPSSAAPSAPLISFGFPPAAPPLAAAPSAAPPAAAAPASHPTAASAPIVVSAAVGVLGEGSLVRHLDTTAPQPPMPTSPPVTPTLAIVKFARLNHN